MIKNLTKSFQFSLFRSNSVRLVHNLNLFNLKQTKMNGHLNHRDSTSSNSSNQMKYILITGGVISGIGKGILASSIGSVLKASGLKITSIKIDPYINIDAGTFSPYEHGEVFVLDDGGEVDLDLGKLELNF